MWKQTNLHKERKHIRKIQGMFSMQMGKVSEVESRLTFTCRYCSRECQVAHWKNGHKEACGKVVTPEDMKEHRVIIGPDV